MRVVFVALERALASSITIPLEMLHAARTISRVNGGPNANLELLVAGIEPGISSMAGELLIAPATAIESIDQSDLIFVPGLWGSPVKTLRKSGTLLEWLVKLHGEGSILCSLVTGSYFLAEAGLLDGRDATTHWYYFDDFESRYPRVRLERKRFITLDNNLYCTGSVNAARDVTLHLVEEIFGTAIASDIAKHFTHEIKRSYESMLLGYQQRETHHDELIIKIQEWIQGNYQHAVQIDELASRFKISVRSLNRRFKAATRTTPVQYLRETRIDHSRQLLKQSNLTIAEIAFTVGYTDTSHFGSLFRQDTGVTPSEYRSLVRSKLFKVKD